MVTDTVLRGFGGELVVTHPQDAQLVLHACVAMHASSRPSSSTPPSARLLTSRQEESLQRSRRHRRVRQAGFVVHARSSAQHEAAVHVAHSLEDGAPPPHVAEHAGAHAFVRQASTRASGSP
jgi:hypothetical protein